MKIRQSYTRGWDLAIKTIGNSIVLYLANFFLAIILGLSFATSISSDSLLFNQLFKEFNITAFVEFIRSIKSAIPFIQGQFIWLAIAFFLLSIFFTGGVVDSFYNGKFTQIKFWINSSKFFFRYLRQAFYFFILHTVLTVLALLPIFFILQDISTRDALETAYILPLISVFLIFFLVNSIIFIISDYTKLTIYLTETDKVLKALWRSVKFVFKNFFKIYTLFLALIVFPILLILTYWLLSNLIGTSTLASLMISFIVGQIFIFMRIFARIWIMSANFSFYSFYYNKNIAYKKAEFSALDEKAELISQTKFDIEKAEIRQTKEEKAKLVINDVNIMLKGIQEQLQAIEKEARPEIKEELIEKLIETSETEEWEMLEDQAEETNNMKEVTKVISLIDEIKLEKEAKEKPSKINEIKKEDDLFEFED